MMNNLLELFYVTNDEKKRKEIIEEMLNEHKYYLNLILENILKYNELRSNAYLLNLMSKKKKVTDYLKYHFNRNHFEILINSEEPKVRKNAYIFMGNFIHKDYVLDLIKMLKKEDTNYCISSLILALGNYNIKNIEEILNKYLEILNKKEIEEVHYKEIVNSINKVIGKNTKIKEHKFIGLDKEYKFLLTCMEPLVNASFENIKETFKDAYKDGNGIIFKSNDLNKVFKIRTFYEALLVFDNNKELTKELLKDNINKFLNSEFLFKTHLGESVFNYRIEYVSVKNKQDKLNFVTDISKFISDHFSGKYYNNPSSYEFEIRVIDNNDKYDVYYKLHTYKDLRHLYRKKDLPASINPISASIMLNEVKKYLSNGARVLDPFCGTSTMLIERSYLGDCKLTGVDIDPNAIEYSYTNSKAAGKQITLINKNCLEHTGYYDEIISNMPYGNRVSNHVNNEILYKDFINKLPSLLNDSGVAILLTSEISLIKKLLKNKNKLKLVKDIYTETGGLTPHLFVIKKV